MAQKPQIAVEPKEYQGKRFEISKEILAATLSGGKVETMTELKQRESLIFNCVQLADMLLNELGYFPQKKIEELSIHSLSNILKSSKLKDEN